MKRVVLAFIIFSYSQLFSQVVFCPQGAAWSYNYKNTGGGFPGAPTVLEKIVYARDSVVDNVTVKVLRHNFFHLECSFLPINITLIKQVGDTVFMRNYGTDHKWEILYNYAAQVGQSWQTSIRVEEHSIDQPAYTTYTITVDSVSTVSENGFNLRQLHVKYRHQYVQYQSLLIWSSSALITERFGCHKFMFNYYNNSFFKCDADKFQRFLCYSDTEYGTSMFTSFPCDYTNPMSVQNLEVSEVSVRAYPNPASSFIFLEKTAKYSGGELSFQCTNVIGQEIGAKHLFAGSSAKIDLSSFAQGIYFINFFDETKYLFSEKFVKN